MILASEREPARATEAERLRLTSVASVCSLVPKDPAGNISTWRQQADDDPAKVYEFGYDKTDQLTAAILKSTDPTPTILKRQFWSYDPAGNRTAEQNDDAVTGAAYNNMNQLLSQAAGGALVFKGTVNEPANVTVGGKPANVSADNRFEGQAVVPSGTGQVQVTATDPSGNVRTNTYEVSQGATSKAFTYDANGNMTGDGSRTYDWNAENRLVAVKEGATTIASYAYNKDGIRTSRTVDGSTSTFVLERGSIVEERTGGSVLRHFHGPGIDSVLATQDGSGTVTYLTKDHLGSIRERVTSTGTVTLRSDYDSWGRPTSGNGPRGWAFTGRENEPETGLYYYRARYYSADRAAFLSEDPVRTGSTGSQYRYVLNNPLVLRDPSGAVSAPAALPPATETGLPPAEIQNLCGPNAAGCTGVTWSFGCSCKEEGCRWYPQISITNVQHRIYYQTSGCPSPPWVLSHEREHARRYSESWQKALDAMRQRERSGFDSRDACTSFCANDAEAEFKVVLSSGQPGLWHFWAKLVVATTCW